MHIPNRPFFSNEYNYYITVGVNPNLKGMFSSIANSVSGHFYLGLCAVPKNSPNQPLRLLCSIGAATLPGESLLIIQNESLIKAADAYSGMPHNGFVDIFAADKTQVNDFIHFSHYLIEEQKCHQQGQQWSLADLTNRDNPVKIYQNETVKDRVGKFIVFEEIGERKAIENIFSDIEQRIVHYRYKLYDADCLIAEGKIELDEDDALLPPKENNNSSFESEVRKQIHADLKKQGKFSAVIDRTKTQHLLMKCSDESNKYVWTEHEAKMLYPPQKISCDNQQLAQLAQHEDYLKANVPMFVDYSFMDGNTCQALIEPFFKVVYGKNYNDMLGCTQSHKYSHPHATQHCAIVNGKVHLLAKNRPAVHFSGLTVVANQQAILPQQSGHYALYYVSGERCWYLQSGVTGERVQINADNHPALFPYLNNNQESLLSGEKESGSGASKLSATQRETIKALIEIDGARISVESYMDYEASYIKSHFKKRAKQCHDDILNLDFTGNHQYCQTLMAQQQEVLLELLHLARDYYLKQLTESGNEKKRQEYQLKYGFAKEMEKIVNSANDFSTMMQRLKSVQGGAANDGSADCKHSRILGNIVLLVKALANVEKQLSAYLQEAERMEISGALHRVNETYAKWIAESDNAEQKVALNTKRQEMVDKNWRICPSFTTFIQRLWFYQSVRGTKAALTQCWEMVTALFSAPAEGNHLQRSAVFPAAVRQCSSTLSTGIIQQRQSLQTNRYGKLFKASVKESLAPINNSDHNINTCH
ncbi:MAG: hypothetical protein GY821_01015 [Gammaproteobacteria bacterium]|nr:hypothetical protein [Gammaproteobacteria bacterium]